MKKADVLLSVINKDIELTGKVISEPVGKSYGSEFIIKVNEILAPEGTFGIQNDNKSSFNIKLLARNFDKTSDIAAYDTLNITGKIVRYQAHNPGEFDYGKYLARKGIYGVLNIYDFEVIEHGKIPVFYRIVRFLRNRMVSSIKDNLPPEEASVLLRMFVGEKATLEGNLRDVFVDAGVMHVLVVSGLHVGYIVAIFWFLLRFVPAPNKIRNLLLVVPVLFYCFITGANPPVLAYSSYL